MPRKPNPIPTPRARTRYLDKHAHEPGHLIEAITKAEFDDALIRYERLLIQLTDEETAKIRKTGGVLGMLLRREWARYVDIPEWLRKRRQDEGGAWLEPRDVEQLVDWQMEHAGLGAYIGLRAKSNMAATVEGVTRRAYRKYESGQPKEMEDALKILITLAGVNLETASLWLAVYDPEIPFFSPELFRWTQWNGEVGKKDAGWKQRIVYSYGNYVRLLDSVTALRSRLKAESGEGISVVDVEKVAWVLGREAEGFVALEGDYEKRKRMEAEEAVRLETTYQNLTEAEAKEAAGLLMKRKAGGAWTTGLRSMDRQQITRWRELAEKESGETRKEAGEDSKSTTDTGSDGRAASENVEAERTVSERLDEVKPTPEVMKNAVRANKRKKGLGDGDGNVRRSKRLSKEQYFT